MKNRIIFILLLLFRCAQADAALTYGVDFRADQEGQLEPLRTHVNARIEQEGYLGLYEIMNNPSYLADQTRFDASQVLQAVFRKIGLHILDERASTPTRPYNTHRNYLIRTQLLRRLFVDLGFVGNQNEHEHINHVTEIERAQHMRELTLGHINNILDNPNGHFTMARMKTLGVQDFNAHLADLFQARALLHFDPRNVGILVGTAPQYTHAVWQDLERARRHGQSKLTLFYQAVFLQKAHELDTPYYDIVHGPIQGPHNANGNAPQHAPPFETQQQECLEKIRALFEAFHEESHQHPTENPGTGTPPQTAVKRAAHFNKTSAGNDPALKLLGVGVENFLVTHPAPPAPGPAPASQPDTPDYHQGGDGGDDTPPPSPPQGPNEEDDGNDNGGAPETPDENDDAPMPDAGPPETGGEATAMEIEAVRAAPMSDDENATEEEDDDDGDEEDGHPAHKKARLEYALPNDQYVTLKEAIEKYPFPKQTTKAPYAVPADLKELCHDLNAFRQGLGLKPIWNLRVSRTTKTLYQMFLRGAKDETQHYFADGDTTERATADLKKEAETIMRSHPDISQADVAKLLLANTKTLRENTIKTAATEEHKLKREIDIPEEYSKFLEDHTPSVELQNQFIKRILETERLSIGHIKVKLNEAGLWCIQKAPPLSEEQVTTIAQIILSSQKQTLSKSEVVDIFNRSSNKIIKKQTIYDVINRHPLLAKHLSKLQSAKSSEPRNQALQKKADALFQGIGYFKTAPKSSARTVKKAEFVEIWQAKRKEDSPYIEFRDGKFNQWVCQSPHNPKNIKEAEIVKEVYREIFGQDPEEAGGAAAAASA